MHNLLLEENKRIIKKEYHLRLFCVLLLSLSALGTVFFVLLLPSLIWSDSKEKAILGRKELLSKSVFSLEKENLHSLLVDTKEKVSSLKSENSQLPIHLIIKEVLKYQNEGIQITGFTFQPEKNANRALSIDGVASSRDKLVQFRKNLESEKTFTVSLPVSNFAKQSNIDFTLNLGVKLN